MQQIHACAIYKQMDFGENLKHRKNDNELLWGFYSMSAQLLNPTTFRMTSIAVFGGWAFIFAKRWSAPSTGLDHEPRSAGDKLETKRPTTYGAGVYGITPLTR